MKHLVFISWFKSTNFISGPSSVIRTSINVNKSVFCKILILYQTGKYYIWKVGSNVLC